MATTTVQKHLFIGLPLLHSHFSVPQQDLTILGKHQRSRGAKKISFWVSQFYWNIEASLDICNWWNKVISVASTVLSYVNDFHSKAG